MKVRFNWVGYNRGQERIIAASTSLKIKVELFDAETGHALECASVNTTREGGDWMAKKVSEYRLHSPLTRIRFRVV